MKQIKILLLSALALTFTTQSAFAATSDATLNVGVTSNGSLEMVAPSRIDFPDLEFNADAVYGITDLGELTVRDGRGTGEGWILTVEGSQIAEVGGKGLTFGYDAFMMYAPASITNDTTIDNAPTATTVPYGRIQSAPYTLATAYLGSGSGTWKVDLGSLEIASNSVYPLIDKENYPNQPTPYQATLTFSLVTGP